VKFIALFCYPVIQAIYQPGDHHDTQPADPTCLYIFLKIRSAHLAGIKTFTLVIYDHRVTEMADDGFYFDFPVCAQHICIAVTHNVGTGFFDCQFHGIGHPRGEVIFYALSVDKIANSGEIINVGWDGQFCFFQREVTGWVMTILYRFSFSPGHPG